MAGYVMAMLRCACEIGKRDTATKDLTWYSSIALPRFPDIHRPQGHLGRDEAPKWLRISAQESSPFLRISSLHSQGSQQSVAQIRRRAQLIALWEASLWRVWR